MKTVVIGLSLLVAVLGWRLWQNSRSAQTALDGVRAEWAAISNHLAEARMKLTHQEQLASIAQTKLDRKFDEFAALSNTMAVVHGELAKARSETSDQKAALARAIQQHSDLESELKKTRRTLGELGQQNSALDTQVAQMKNVLEKSDAQLAVMANDVQRLKAEKAELVVQWNEPHALRLRLSELQQQARAKTSSKALAQRLALQPDGSVNLVTAPTTD